MYETCFHCLHQLHICTHQSQPRLVYYVEHWVISWTSTHLAKDHTYPQRHCQCYQRKYCCGHQLCKACCLWMQFIWYFSISQGHSTRFWRCTHSVEIGSAKGFLGGGGQGGLWNLASRKCHFQLFPWNIFINKCNLSLEFLVTYNKKWGKAMVKCHLWINQKVLEKKKTNASIIRNLKISPILW